LCPAKIVRKQEKLTEKPVINVADKVDTDATPVMGQDLFLADNSPATNNLKISQYKGKVYEFRY
jgi:hypothetical protein